MHKTIASLLFSSMLISSSLLAQSSNEKEVAERVESLRKAMIAADKPALMELAAEDLTYGHSVGLIQDKASFIEALMKGESVFKTIVLSDQTIKITGDVATVRHHFVADTNNNNVPGKADLLVLLVWQKQKGKWKLLARQAVKSPGQ